MASDKKKKSKGKTLPLTEFLSDTNLISIKVSSSSNWADDADNDGEDDHIILDRSKLPTAPRAARGPDFDINRLPSEPPFKAYLGNLPYDVDRNDIEKFFYEKGIKLLNVRIPEDGGRQKGFGYAEFETKQGLIDALSNDNETLNNRKIRIDLAEHQQGERNTRSNYRHESEDDKTQSDWRARSGNSDSFSGREDGYGQRQGGYSDRNNDYGQRGYGRDQQQRRDYSNQSWDRSSSDRSNDRYGRRNEGGRYGDQGGNQYDRYGDRGNDRYSDRGADRYGSSERYGDRNSDRYGDRGGDRYGDRGGDCYNRPNDRYGDDRYNYRGGSRYGDRGGNRYNNRGNNQYDDQYRNRGGGSDRPYERDGNRYYNRGGSSDQQRDRPVNEEAPDDVPAERPKLKLQPRSKAAEPVVADEADRKSSIFGGAKPVDTASKELEIEQRLNQQKQADARLHETRERERDMERERHLSSGSVGRPRHDSESTHEGSTSSDKRRELAPPPVTAGSGSLSRQGSLAQSEGDVFDEGPEKGLPDSKRPSGPTGAHMQRDVLVPAPPPKENAWDKRRAAVSASNTPTRSGETPRTSTQPAQQRESQQRESQQREPQSREREPNKVSVSVSAQSQSWGKGKPPNTGPGPVHGYTDRRKQEYKSDNHTHHDSKRREKALPTSLDEMPKFEEKSDKNWSDKNKFSMLEDDDNEVLQNED